jgi:hypothetical protein
VLALRATGERGRDRERKRDCESEDHLVTMLLRSANVSKPADAST